MLSFKQFLAEFTTDTDNVSDPQFKQNMMRLTRTDPDKAGPLQDKMKANQDRKQRTAIQQEKNPQIMNLMRKKVMLQKQIDTLDQQISTARDAAKKGTTNTPTPGQAPQ